MSTQRTDDRRFAALERWRALELDEAKAERAALEEAARIEQAQADELTRQIENTRALAREITTRAQSFSAGALREASDYAAWQAGALHRKTEALEEARKRVETAQAAVAQRFKALSVLEKLQARRKREHAFESARRDQKLLDDQAIGVLSDRISGSIFNR